MKTKINLIGIILLVILTNGTANSQRLSIGGKGGYVLSKHLTNLTDNISKNIKGISAGIYFNYRFSNLFGIAAEVNYIEKGNTLTANSSSTSFEEVETKLTYASIPLLFKMGTKIENDFYPYCFGGPRIDINIKNDENKVEGLYKNLKDPNFGVSVGFGVIYEPAGEINWGVEFRFSPDLTKFPVKGYSYKNYITNFPNGVEFSNMSFEINLVIGGTFIKGKPTPKKMKTM